LQLWAIVGDVARRAGVNSCDGKVELLRDRCQRRRPPLRAPGALHCRARASHVVLMPPPPPLALPALSISLVSHAHMAADPASAWFRGVFERTSKDWDCSKKAVWTSSPVVRKR
jgi:hypothetical protein